ncbi:MAG TPA: BREX system P-loop protein BrxC [Bryobacteraceae bacterium]|nr:BREX system P-loop protein BrxC [Bryobacteraceae bacterium]
MKTIGDLLARDLSRKIEEIIQVDQSDEQAVYSEITEYVATDSIRNQYATLLKAVADAPTEPHESVGIWVSGFFGSGKSSFAKYFGYALQNRKVLGKNFADLFKQQVDHPQVRNLLDLINTRYPTEVILFDVAKEQDTRRVTQRIAEFIYAVVLRELDYAEDFDIAELEIELEAEGKLEQFVAKCKEIHGQDWRIVRKGAQRLSRASAVLHALDPRTYPAADSWARTQRNRDASITVSKVVQRTFELFGRRRPGKAIVLVIDEVGQHVARSADKIEDLRATVEEFGKVGRNLLKARKIPAPCWIVVTSQEKLEEVVDAIDSKRVELAKLQDRFRYRVDLAPSDIREVATKRVLAKKEEAIPLLKRLYAENQGALNAALRLERTSRQTHVSEEDFVQFYPYPPHYIDLCISIMSGIRLQPGAPRHLGGSNRTIIKQAYEMLVSERTALAKAPIGALVTLDRIYELVEGNLSNERRTDIHAISERFKSDPDAQKWALRVAKVICLLEFVRDLPRTAANIAAFLVDKVGDAPPLSEVQAALKRLHEAQFIRETEDGWKLQTAQEKNWETEKKAHDPKPRDRNEILRQTLRHIFSEPSLRTYRHKDCRTFRVGISVDGTAIGDEGDITLSLAIAEDDTDLPKRVEEARDNSRQKAHENDLYWVFALTSEIDELVAQLYASRKMVEKYDQLRAQSKITHEEATCLQDEKNTVLGLESRLQTKLTEALQKGIGMFRGVAHEAASLGKTLNEIIRKFLDQVVPDLYPKLEMGSRPLQGDEAELFLKAQDLTALPQVFYAGERGLALVIKEGTRLVPNPAADVAKEVRDYLVSQSEYGNLDACLGRSLEQRFNHPPYGWERDMLRLVLAVLFRAGVIEVSFGGQKFSSFTDPRSREPFVNNTKFKSARFTPVKPIDVKTLTQAVLCYEDLTGKTTDVEKNAIAAAAKSFAEEELKQVLPVEAQVQAHSLPVISVVEAYREELESIVRGSADDCVSILAGGALSLKEGRDRIRKIADALTEKGLRILQLARLAAGEMRLQLEAHGQAELAAKAKHVHELIQSETFFEQMAEIESATNEVVAAYRALYKKTHADRATQFQEAIDKIKGRPEWQQVPESMREPVLSPLASRACAADDFPQASLTCAACGASINQMESDLEALGGLFGKVVSEIQRLTTPPEVKIKRVRVAEFLSGSFESPDQVKQALARLQDYLLKLLDEGVKIVVE